jgi:hypothetical protein
MECAGTTQPGWLFGIYDNAAVRIEMVAREGIEPPTPAFSGPRSTTELPGRGDFPGGNSAHAWKNFLLDASS